MKKKLTRITLAFSLVLLLGQTTWAQRKATPNKTPAIIETASQEAPIQFDYKDTPAICYGAFGRNPFTNFTPEQLTILATYDYPHFVSHGKAMIEQDLLVFKAAHEEWNTNNAHRKDEILESLGISQ